MPSWFKKVFSKKKKEGDASSSSPTGSTQSAASSQRSSRQNSQRFATSSGSPGAPRPSYGLPPPGPSTRRRVSSHDLAVTAGALGMTPPRTPSTASTASPRWQSSRPDLSRQQVDADLAMAYSMAQQAAGNMQFGGPPSPLQQSPNNVVTSPFGEAVSLPPPAAGTKPNIAMAAALADSQFSARQADEFARANEAVYEAAVNRALEASLRTVTYDDLLRDIKLWIIDLAAATDDVLAALDSLVKRRNEVAERLERALQEDDDRRIKKLEWMVEQLPAAEENLRKLADKMTPVGVAVVELQDLRDHVFEVAPPVAEAEKMRDTTLGKLFKAMEAAGLRPLSRASENGSGPSTSTAAPADLRDMVAALIDDAQRIPSRHSRKYSDSYTSSNGSPEAQSNGATPATPETDTRKKLPKYPFDTPPFQLSQMAQDVPESRPDEEEQPWNPPKKYPFGQTPFTAKSPKTPESPSAEEESTKKKPVRLPFGGKLPFQPFEKPTPAVKAKQSPVKPTSTSDATASIITSNISTTSASASGVSVLPSRSPSMPSASFTSQRSSSHAHTTPAPFNLSSSRWKAKGPAGAPQPIDALRRVPGLISMHNELIKGSGVVRDAVGWEDDAPYRPVMGEGMRVMGPREASVHVFTSPEEMVSYVRENNGFPEVSPSRFDRKNRWSVMCSAAGLYYALDTAIEGLSKWEVGTSSNAAIECHKLVNYIARVATLVGEVTHEHDPLRQAIAKHELPWDGELASKARWAAQHAAWAVMSYAIECSEGAERVKGPWQRHAVLGPLGHAIMAGFSVHQLAGGFSIQAASTCDQLLERLVHYARLIDPKWFRGHKVVK